MAMLNGILMSKCFTYTCTQIHTYLYKIAFHILVLDLPFFTSLALALYDYPFLLNKSHDILSKAVFF